MKLPIRKYGDPILRAKGKRIEEVDDKVRALAENMLETMHAANGIGLAAQQVGRAIKEVRKMTTEVTEEIHRGIDPEPRPTIRPPADSVSRPFPSPMKTRSPATAGEPHAGNSTGVRHRGFPEAASRQTT